MKMRLCITLVLLLATVIGSAQKVNPCAYINVDTMIYYKNAETITYKNKTGKSVTDTLYFSKMKCDIKIENVDVLIMDDEKVLKKN